MSNKRKRFIKVLKILGKVLLGILVFLLLVILFIRSPWGQNIIKDKFISSVEKKTGATIELEKLFITFDGDLEVNQLYLEDPEGDTVAYAKSISANIGLWSLIKGNSFDLNELEVEDLRARIIRKDSLEGFNFEFLTEAYATDSTQTQTPADTTSASMGFNIGDIGLNKIDLVYKDDVTGIDSRFILGTLNLEFTETDLENMIFRLADAKLTETRVNYEQTKPFPESDAEPPPMPVISVENLNISEVSGKYNSQPDSIDTDFEITNFELNDSEFDLKNNNINSSLISLSNSKIGLRMQQDQSPVPEESKSSSSFEWPEWNVDLKTVDLQNNSFNYIINNETVSGNKFNPNAVKIDSLVFMASNLIYQPRLVKAELQQLKFQEASGIAVNEFNLDVELDDKQLELKDLLLNANQNSLAGSLVINYDDFDQFIKQPGESNIQLDLNTIDFRISDLFRFQPELRENPYLDSLAGSTLRGNLVANGKIDNVNLQALNLSWKNTSIQGRGRIMNMQEPDDISFDLPVVQLDTRREDLLKFVKEADLGIQIPDTLNLEGSFAGNLEKIRTNTILNTSEGTLALDGNINMADKISFDAEIQGDSIALGNLLQNEALGNIQLNLKTSGSGSSVNDLSANLDTKISSFTYNNYEFRDINITGKLENGQGPVNLAYKDPNLEMEATSQVFLDSVSPRFEFNLELAGANLGELGITQRDIKTGFDLEGWYEGNSTNYELEAEIRDGVAVYNNKTYLLGTFQATAFVEPDTTSVNIDNRMFDVELQSNASPAAFIASINRHFKRYITQDYKEDSITKPVNMKIDAQISQAPILNEVFLLNLEEMDTVNIDVDFAESERKLDASVSVPYINYFSSQIDSLKFDLNSDREDLEFTFGFNALTAGPLAIKKTLLDGKVLNRKLDLEFTSSYEGEQLVHVNSQLNFQGDTLKYHIDSKDLVLNRNSWNIDNSNQISYATEYLDFNNFILSRNNQEMQLRNDKPGIDKEHLSLDFKNFKLEALLNYLNPENQLAEGELSGNLVYEEPFGETGFLADLEISRFKVMDVDLSTLSLQGESSGFSEYEIDLAIKGGEVDLDLTGSYTAADPSAELDMKLDLNEVKMSSLEGFSQGAITDGSGSFSGNINLDGTLLEPEYDGSLDFNQARFKVAMLNAAFILPDENLSLDNEGVYFDNFNINDTNDNSVVLNGEIITDNLLNPGFDLNVKADSFRLLNSTAEDNELFYGTAVVDVDAQIRGDLNLPEVDMDLDIKESTDFTYVVPETDLQIKDRDGVVIFVNRENPDDILSQNEEESYVVSGYDISAKINVVEGAKFNVIINPETQDKFQVQGEGDLIFNMYPNGRMALTGIYNINDGFYEMSLYNLVKRKFNIADGSRVSWAGDPFDAQLDVRAIYEVETSAYSLMAPTVSGLDNTELDQYNRKLPFLVYLNVDGDLMSPKITFGLDLPEDERGVASGSVYGRVQQLNNQEQELNKQVFSLLVLNRFFPESGSSGASGGTLAVARDNLNSALSDQLNMLSSRILGESGVKLNFDVDSFTDYQGSTAEDRTQLGISAQKGFLDDRLIVEVGSEVDIQGGGQEGQESAPVIGNVSISYLLDPGGIWRIKGFSRNQYENVIDGQLVVSGIALIFTREFNKFKNMFEKAVMENVNKNSENKETEKSASDSSKNEE